MFSFESFEAAYGTPAIADFDDDGLLDIAVATPHGVINFFEPEIEYSSSSESYDGGNCLLYTSPSPRDRLLSRMPSSA